MKMSKKFRAIASAALISAMVMSMSGMSALAANIPTNGDKINEWDDTKNEYVNEKEYAHLYKYLVLDENAHVPNITFRYEITAGDAKVAEKIDDVQYPEVFAGVHHENVKISDITFTPNVATSSELEGIFNKGEGSEALAAGKAYAKGEASIDFSGVEFENPGIYRYVITEKDESKTYPAFDYSKAPLYLDVYVTSDNYGKLSVSGYILHDSPDVAASKDDYTVDSKKTGFLNEYKTRDLSLEKEVTGNQGNRNEYFDFSVTISNAVSGTVYSVDLPDTDCHRNNKAEFAIPDGEDSITEHFYLKHGQNIIIQGLTDTTEYAIEENISDSKGYKTSYVIGTEDSEDATKFTATAMKAHTDNSVKFTNNKEVNTPTGIIMSFAPYILVLALAGVFAVMFLRKKREDF